VIISASYRTDIPTFYGDWFINRLDAGYCKVINPYSRRASRVPLDREAVDAFVFWTKNAGPFQPHLRVVRGTGYPFMIQYTINGYPRALETSVTDAERSIAIVRELASEYGRRVVVWRYDTIIFSSLTPPAFHVDNFRHLARSLRGAVDEVVISFMQLYAKTRRNLDRAAGENGFTWYDPDIEEKRALATELAGIANESGLGMTICSQPEFVVSGTREARCVDADRIQDIALRPIHASLKGNRKECGCYESRDIGDYDTCPHGCVYCYAVRSQDLAKARYHRHDPHSEFLFTPAEPVMEESRRQLKLL
jgi:hypothetical protein